MKSIFYNKFKILVPFISLMIIGCSATRLTDSWKNDNDLGFSPKKILIVGITQSITAKKKFETKLKSEFQDRGIDAGTSSEIFPHYFIETKQSEEQIHQEIRRIKEMGYDAILISTVKGVDEEQSYSQGYARTDYFWRRFKGYYLMYQDIYFSPSYYEKYKIYHIETSLYTIKTEHEDSSLVWIGSFDIVDPKDVKSSINSYVKRVLRTLEKEGLIPKENKK